MFFDLVSNIAEQSERIVHTEMTLEMDSLRAEIENCDRKIAFYEADIIACDRENDEMAMELEMLREEYDFKLCINKRVEINRVNSLLVSVHFLTSVFLTQGPEFVN